MPELMVDRLRIQHVLFALVQNAFDASAQGSGAPRVKVEAHADRYAVETSVTDSGPGVSAAVQRAIVPPVLHHESTGHRARSGLRPRDRRSARRNHRI